MNSFPVGLEPRPCPRLAAALVLLHAAAAVAPWLARCPPLVALALSVVAVAGLAGSLAVVPGPHRRWRRISWRHGHWQVRAAGRGPALAGRVGPGTRVYAGWVVLDLRTARGQAGWLLPRAAVAPADFRRLKARLRLAC